ncbi:MAG: hypothetical protein OJJ55_19000 [Rhodococcus sp.]|nr:hypothetical protein [Rhodococcus sp. (in: high G+C Gram-positive bacteria)]
MSRVGLHNLRDEINVRIGAVRGEMMDLEEEYEALEQVRTFLDHACSDKYVISYTKKPER